MSGSRFQKVLGTVGLLLVTGLLATGCASKSTPITGDDPGAKLVQSKCTLCHTLDRVEKAEKDTAGWNATVDKMRGKGAVVSESEQEQIVTFLSNR